MQMIFCSWLKLARVMPRRSSRYLMTTAGRWVKKLITISLPSSSVKKSPIRKKNMINRDVGFRRVDEFELPQIHLAMKRLNKVDFAKIIQKAMSKIKVWGNKHLSIARKDTLIRTLCHSNLHTHTRDCPKSSLT